MKWLKNYLAKRREESVQRQAEAQKEEQELVERTRYVDKTEAMLDNIVRYRFGVAELNKLTGEEHELIHNNLVKMSRITYESWETEWAVADMEKIREYKSLFDQGWVALVNYDKSERSGRPVRRVQKYSSTNL